MCTGILAWPRKETTIFLNVGGDMRSRILLASFFVVAAPTLLQAQQKAEILKFEAGGQATKSIFAGNESRIGALNSVLSDCNSGPRPDVRVIKGPANGEIRFEPLTIPIDRPKNNARAHCNGKPTDALGLYYKPKEGFTGEERITIDADWRNGNVDRFTYIVNVR